jgi:hypothetical protein
MPSFPRDRVIYRSRGGWGCFPTILNAARWEGAWGKGPAPGLPPLALSALCSAEQALPKDMQEAGWGSTVTELLAKFN